jgi:hypothetical protein
MSLDDQEEAAKINPGIFSLKKEFANSETAASSKPAPKKKGISYEDEDTDDNDSKPNDKTNIEDKKSSAKDDVVEKVDEKKSIFQKWQDLEASKENSAGKRKSPQSDEESDSTAKTSTTTTTTKKLNPTKTKILDSSDQILNVFLLDLRCFKNPRRS